MSEKMTLAPFYADWSKQNERLIKAIAPLTPEQLLLRPAENMWPVSVLAAHIVGARVYWFHEIMKEGPPEVARWSGLDDLEEEARTREALLQGLQDSWGLIEGMLARCGPDSLGDVFERPGGTRVRTYTRQALIMRVLGHDHHHGGEISSVLGMHGLVGLDE
jgi:uncharacterized damage-inducible protein DinB